METTQTIDMHISDAQEYRRVLAWRMYCLGYRQIDIATGLLQCSGSCLLQTLRRSAILTQSPADVGLKLLLQELARDGGARNGHSAAIHITHAQLAGVLHLSRETVSRMLGQMAERGLVELGRGVIRVRMPERT